AAMTTRATSTQSHVRDRRARGGGLSSGSGEIGAGTSGGMEFFLLFGSGAGGVAPENQSGASPVRSAACPACTPGTVVILQANVSLVGSAGPEHRRDRAVHC